jgi:hypothetical protein
MNIFFKKLLLVVFGGVFSLLLLEAGFRIVLPAQKEAFSRQIVTVDEKTGYTIHKKNFNEIVYSNELEKNVRIITNSEGFVGKDYPIEKDENTTRIAVIGDSYVAALQVDTEKNFVSLLEKELNKNPSQKFEVMNFGVGGQGTFEELARYYHYVRKYKPDYVVLVFYPNDFENNQYYLQYKDLVLEDKPLWDIPLSDANNNQGRRDIKYLLMKNSYVVRFLDARVKQNAYLSKIAIALGLQSQGPLGAPKEGIHPTTFIFEEPLQESFSDVYEFTVDLVKYFNRRAKEDGAKLIFAYLPMAIQVDDILWKEKADAVPELSYYTWNLNGPNTYLKENLFKEGISFLDLTPIFKKEHEKDPSITFYNGREGHFNEKGHAIVEKNLRNQILNKTP